MFNKGNFFSFYVSSQKRFSFLFLVGLLSQVIGVMQGSSSSVLKAAKVARPNVTVWRGGRGSAKSAGGERLRRQR